MAVGFYFGGICADFGDKQERERLL